MAVSDLARLPSHVVWPATCLPTLQLGSLALALRMPGLEVVVQWCSAVPSHTTAGRQAPADPVSTPPAGPSTEQAAPPPPPHTGTALVWSGLVWSTDWNTIVTSSPTSSLTSVTTQIYQPEKLKYFLFFIALLRLLCWCSCLSQPTILNW